MPSFDQQKVKCLQKLFHDQSPQKCGCDRIWIHYPRICTQMWCQLHNGAWHLYCLWVVFTVVWFQHPILRDLDTSAGEVLHWMGPLWKDWICSPPKKLLFRADPIRKGLNIQENKQKVRAVFSSVKVVENSNKCIRILWCLFKLALTQTNLLNGNHITTFNYFLCICNIKENCRQFKV